MGDVDRPSDIERYPRLEHRCPACNGNTLRLYVGHVTCSLIGCPNPVAAADLLDNQRGAVAAIRAIQEAACAVEIAGEGMVPERVLTAIDNAIDAYGGQ